MRVMPRLWEPMEVTLGMSTPENLRNALERIVLARVVAVLAREMELLRISLLRYKLASSL